MIGARLETAKTLARAAGALIRGACDGSAGYELKRNSTDLVTATDVAAESAIVSGIRAAFPDDAIVAEEQGGDADRSIVWYVDPLDGTTNFAHGFPVFAVSIAVVVEQRTEAGVVYLPVWDWLYSAARGEGAFCNGAPIHVSQTESLERSLLGTGFPYNRREIADELLGRVARAFAHSQGIRRAGAASVDLCFVASGQLDGYWEQNLAPWDWAAGALIVEEAGGRISDFEGAPFCLGGRTLCASNGRIHDQLVSRITACVA
ncbi:MAG: inositol monophosphatase [Myxococcales bacterium]|nr:inositol monophosphatase [Myxococcales bacterium]